ncbi:MAG: energy-coupled thiamine transporter ThiT [Peptostreptococcaceae bacterium]
MILMVFVVSLCMALFYVNEIKKTKFDTKLVVTIGVLSGVAFVLNMIKFINMPQGGSITLFSMMPIMLIGLLYGKGAGLSAGIILGCLKMLDGVTFIHPMQFMLDYILANMFLGLSGMFGKETKIKILIGCFVASLLSVMTNVVSGAVFFGEYAPEGMNVWVYSMIYNFSSLGVEAFLTTILMVFIPISKLEKITA